jgi:hypothetical protein
MNSRACGRQRDTKRQWRVLTGSRPGSTGRRGLRPSHGSTVHPTGRKCRTGTREPATARGGGTNRPAIRGQGRPHRKVWVSWRRHSSFDPRLARGTVQHFAARTSVRSPWGARAAADRRVRARRSKVGSLEECPLTIESVAEIGERHLPNSGIIGAQPVKTAAKRRSKRVPKARVSDTA